MKNIRVLHCPFNIGDHRWLLSRIERKLGVQSDLVIFAEPRFASHYDRYLHINAHTIPNEIKKILFLKEAIKKYDVFHFNAGSSIWDNFFPGLNLLDLPILKKAGKKIIVTYHGDDARQKDYFLSKFNINYHSEKYYRSKKYSYADWFLDTNKKMRIKRYARYADKFLAISPDLMNFLPKGTVLMPTCIRLDDIPPQIKKKPNSPIRVVHAPSDRFIKGTETVISAVKELADKYPIEFVLVENIPHEQALELYRTADIAIDQFVVGWYGTFAVELMARGVPVIAYLRESDLEKFVPFYKEIPVINAQGKEEIKDAVSVLIENPHLRKKIGLRSHQYVRTYHNPEKLAQRLVNIYREITS